MVEPSQQLHQNSVISASGGHIIWICAAQPNYKNRHVTQTSQDMQ